MNDFSTGLRPHLDDGFDEAIELASRGVELKPEHVQAVRRNTGWVADVRHITRCEGFVPRNARKEA